MNKEHKKSFLAIEFASSAVKLVQMKEGENGFELVHVRSIPIPVGERSKNQKELWSKAVKELFSQESLARQELILAINNPHTCFSQFVIPRIPKKELAETLKWKMKDEMSFPPEEAVIDCRIFELTGGEKTAQSSALVAALPRDLVNGFQEILPTKEGFSFAPAYAPFSVLAFPNAFSLSSGGLIVVVDIGHSITEIAFYIEGKLSFLRKIAFGGQVLNQALIQPLGSEKGSTSLSQEEAEQVKRQENLFDLTNQNLAGNKIEVSKLYALIRPELEKLCGELKRSFDYYAQQYGVSATHIFLTGGTSRLKGLTQFLEEKLEISVKRIELSKDIRISTEVQTQDLDLYYRLISVILDRRDAAASRFVALQKSAERFARSLSYTKTLIAVSLIVLIFAGGMFWRNQQVVRKTKALQLQINNLKFGFGESEKIKEIENQIDRGKILTSAILEKEPYWDEVFRELGHVFSEDVVVKNIVYNQNSLVISGIISNVDSQSSVSDLLRSIEGPVFHKVTLVSSEQNEGFINFIIRCEIGP